MSNKTLTWGFRGARGSAGTGDLLGFGPKYHRLRGRAAERGPSRARRASEAKRSAQRAAGERSQSTIGQGSRARAVPSEARKRSGAKRAASRRRAKSIDHRAGQPSEGRPERGAQAERSEARSEPQASEVNQTQRTNGVIFSCSWAAEN